MLADSRFVIGKCSQLLLDNVFLFGHAGLLCQFHVGDELKKIYDESDHDILIRVKIYSRSVIYRWAISL